MASLAAHSWLGLMDSPPASAWMVALHTSGDSNERVAFLSMGLGAPSGLLLVIPQPAAQQLGSSIPRHPMQCEPGGSQPVDAQYVDLRLTISSLIPRVLSTH